jgi:hypothetical protein
MSSDDSPPQASPVVEGMSANGKYFRLEVPNFNNGVGGPPMTTYLHMGAVRDLAQAANPAAPPATGEDLASQITTFIDDTRLRDGCPEFIPEGTRQAVTAKLHTLGGWRDHSDGNRVTTTRGDKVEIIKGNYRMLVLGRQEEQAGVDISGGHVSQSGITFAGSSSIEWTQDYGGTWKVTETTTKGDVYTTYMGDTYDWYYGNIKTSVTGTESPSATQPNPTITDSTWAVAIASYTGSAALPVPTMSSETWATAITSTTVATTMTDTTEATSMTSTTTCPSITTTTTGNTTATVTGNTTSTTTGNSTSTTTGNTVDTLIGSSTSVTLGAQTSVLIGNMSQVTVGATENVTVGGVLDVSIAARLELNMAAGFKFTADGMMELNPLQKDEINTLKNELEETKTSLALTRQYVGAVFECLHAEIMLGG